MECDCTHHIITLLLARRMARRHDEGYRRSHSHHRRSQSPVSGDATQERSRSDREQHDAKLRGAERRDHSSSSGSEKQVRHPAKSARDKPWAAGKGNDPWQPRPRDGDNIRSVADNAIRALEKASAENSAAASTAVQQNKAYIEKSMADLQERYDHRFETVEAKVEQHASSIKSQGEQLAEALQRLSVVEGSVKECRERLGAAERHTVTRKTPGWDAKGDPTMLRVSCKGTVAKAAVCEHFEGLCRQAKIDPGLTKCITSDDLAAIFHFQFQGTEQLAHDKVVKILSILRGPDRKWNPQFVLGPSADNIQVWYGLDMGRREERTGMLCRRLVKLLREDLGATDNRIYFDADTGEVTINFIPVVKVDCPSAAETNVMWDREGLATYTALDKESVLERFRAGARRVQAREGQWSL